MKTDRNAIRAGSFMVVTVILIVTVILSINGVQTFIEGKQTLACTFSLADDIGGLRVGDDVRIGGALVGEVTSVRIDQDKQQIRVLFRIPSAYTVKKDARLSVQGTITGTSWLNFESLGTAASARLTSDDTIEGNPSAMAALLTNLSQTSPDLKGLIADARTKTLPKINTLMDNASGAAGHLKDMFGDSKEDYKTTVANLKSVTGTFKEKLPPLLDKADGAITSARDTLTDLKATASTARSVVVGNRTKLEQMIAGLKTTSDNLKATSVEVRHSPWRLLYKPEPDEVHNLNLFDSARQFSEGASQLNDAASALRDALKSPNPDPAELQKLEERLEKTFTNFHDVEQKLWQTVKE